MARDLALLVLERSPQEFGEPNITTTLQVSWPYRLQNVRRLAVDAWGAHPSFHLNRGRLQGHMSELQAMMGATFCLAPPAKGGGWSDRAWKAVMAGCIPVRGPFPALAGTWEGVETACWRQTTDPSLPGLTLVV